ncbi:hypothetical protein, partial [Acetomicrobium sp. S15 = DSM 107314]|uniref:hypothetical protein n=1 Tax=Acetomicrobium sp. S15 = DSM 107314 TaxID=2529858 RepID=UPI0018E111E1
RISYLGLELKDVLDGKRELEELIRLTDRQAGDVFKGALKKIDGRFDALFRLLLGGGEAPFRLEEGVSLWDAGVEVICRPLSRLLHWQMAHIRWILRVPYGYGIMDPD